MNARAAMHDALVHLTRRSVALKLIKYSLEARSFWRDHPGSLSELASRFGHWQRSLSPGRRPLVDASPWITYGAIDFLQRTLNTSMRVFEYGAGGSSLFFAARVRSGVSIEHHALWTEEVRRALSAAGRDWQVHLIEPSEIDRQDDPRDPKKYGSADKEFPFRSFEAYVRAIDAFDDASFDVVFVDGRARPACVRHGMPKVVPGGHLMLDNSDVATYAAACALLDAAGWARTDFCGPAPYTFGFSQTTVWRRPK